MTEQSPASLTYTQIVNKLRANFGRDIEGRFHIGELVAQALDLGRNTSEIATDVGVDRRSLDTYWWCYKFWGTDRIPTSRSWRHYVQVANIHDAASAAKVKEAVLGGMPVATALEAIRASRVPLTDRDADRFELGQRQTALALTVQVNEVVERLAGMDETGLRVAARHLSPVVDELRALIAPYLTTKRAAVAKPA